MPCSTSYVGWAIRRGSSDERESLMSSDLESPEHSPMPPPPDAIPAAERYRAGTATLLDVIIAQRDSFSAEIAQIQSDSDLAYARASLRITAGRSL